MYPIKLTFIVILFLLFSPIAEAKKRCKPLLEKLHNIQAMQRNGYSSKRGLSLRDREDKARDNWWQCEQGRGKKAKNKDKKKRASKASLYRSKNRSKVTNIKKASATNKKIKTGTPFKNSNAIVIKSKYQGEKKRAWLAFYQQPTRCQRPKSLQVFAFCSEDKQMQRIDFEQKYSQ